MGILNFFENMKRKKQRDELLKEAAKGVADAMTANTPEIVTRFINDPEYGLVASKPIYCNMVDGSKEYLLKLRTTAGQQLVWNRRGSISIEGINGSIDIYDGRLATGEMYLTLYINMYDLVNSTVAPQGFIIVDDLR